MILAGAVHIFTKLVLCLFYSFGYTGLEKGALVFQDDLVYKCFLQIALLKRRLVIPRELVECSFHHF